jgi:pyruvate dehydrogenase E2 component (dihydrolipoamide acetyltransferase)
MFKIIRNVELGKPARISGWRKAAIGTWRTAGDPSMFGVLELNAEPALAYIAREAAKTGTRITITHFAGKVIAETIKNHPEMNHILRYGQLRPRKNIDIFFLVATDKNGEDLTGLTIREADKKTTTDIAIELDAQVKDIRRNGDVAFNGMKRTLGFFPGIFTQTIMNIAGFLMYGLNVWTPFFGYPRDPFGSVMITNIGALGLTLGFAPLTPYSRVPIMISLGAIHEAPVVDNGAVRVGKIIKLGATIDHRLIDGAHAAKIAHTIKRIFENPETALRDALT